MHAITAFNDSVKEQNATTILEISQSYSDSVRALPTLDQNMEFRQIIRDTKNDELAQIREREAPVKKHHHTCFSRSIGRSRGN